MSGLTGKEIFEKIQSNNKIIEDNLNPGIFVLNEKIRTALEENNRLRAKCPHVFQNDVCVFCGVEKGLEHDVQ